MQENNCKKCDEVDTEEMVQCDHCDLWFHFKCVGVDSAVADRSWNCQLCQSNMPTRNTASILNNPIFTSSPTTEPSSGLRHVQFTSSKTLSSNTQPITCPSTPAMSLRSFSGSNEKTNTTSIPTLVSNIMSAQTYSSVSTSGVPIVATAGSTFAATNPLRSGINIHENSCPDTASVRYSESEMQQARHHNIFLSAQGNSNSASAVNVENSIFLRNLQLERLEEEMKLQQQYLDNKYKILSQSGEGTSVCSQMNTMVMAPTTTQLAARQAIPKNLPTFSGDPDEWPLFISSFENSTTVAGFSDAENLMRLQSCLKGKARDMVKHKLLLPSMVPEIIQTLRLCFGRPEHILERAMNKARSMPMVKDKLEALIEFALCVRNICATIEGCHLDMHLHNPFLVKELVEKLPNTYKLNWAMFPKDQRMPIVKVFSDWLYQLAEAASTVVTLAPSRNNATVNTHILVDDSAERHLVRSSAISKCYVCERENHKVPQCEKFKNATLDCKWEYVRQKNLCRQCLGVHRRRCFSDKVCGINGCSAKHHQLLHKHQDVAQSQSSPPTTSVLSQNASLNAHSSSGAEKLPYFRIVPLNLHSKGKSIKTYAFLDEGSAVTLIEKSIFNELELQGVPEPLCLRWTGDTTRKENESVKTNITVSSTTSGYKYQLKDVHTVNSLDLPAQSLDINDVGQRYSYIAGLPIQSYTNVKPTIIIGANNWKLAVPLKIKEGKWNQPIASKTRLGWTLQGCDNSSLQEFRLNVHMCDCQKQLEELHETVKQYFALESPKSSQLLSADDNRAMQILNETCKEVNGRYEVGLTWRYLNFVLPESYANAIKRGLCLRKKIEKDPTLKMTIQLQIDNLISKGYAKKLSNAEASVQNGKIWYLPIFIVKNPNKPGKVRLVWDAAAKAYNASLNDFLLSGPDLLNPLIEVLLAFRVGKIAICGDIAEMFHRINVRDSDMHAQRFLWWNDSDDLHSPSIYVMRALPFGICCAPFIAHFIRNKNAEKFMAEFPRAVQAVQKNHYVDDFIDSEDDESAALELAIRVKQIHAAAGFKIRNWASNSTYLLNQLEEGPITQPNSKDWGSATKVLGMYWEPANDMFRYICRFSRLRRDVITESVVPTKRETLQVLMSIFDPLGLVSCYTVGLKILLQNIWRSGIDWDEFLSDNLFEKWCQWKAVIQRITEIEIPRCYSLFFNTATSVQLHTFVDAGENAYAAVAYLRIEQEGKISVALVAAKSKVAPLKPISIPRLELQAAVVGIRLAKKVLNVDRIRTTSQFWWTDSKTVLKWLHMDPKNFQQFVMHRVGEIVEYSNVSQWKWVPSKMNPADAATKVSTQANTHLWFSGPNFLLSPCEHWPNAEVSDFKGNADVELKRTLLMIGKSEATLQLNVEYFSSWRRLYRAVATFILYLEKLKTNTNTKSHVVTFDMLQRAQTFLFHYAQLDEYDKEINCLKQHKNVAKNSKLKGLNVYLDESGLIRSKGRAEYLNNHADAIVLPHFHYVTFLLVRSVHEMFHHQMHETIINKIRSKYYISRLRVLYRKVRRMCQTCKNAYATPQVPQMAPLPPGRLAAFERPFTYVGIDYFGPLFVAVGRRREKRWGVIFTCLTVRAVHVEVAHSLDTSSCIMAIRNFIARRGSPREIYSDNGTNFKAAEKVLCDEMKNLNMSLILSKFEKIKWKFNPPAAPHMGGAWERLVRSIKTVLYSICPSKQFNDESIRSALYETEYIINSRPLTFVTIDSVDDEALTPNHLLIGSSDGYKPIYSNNADLRQRWHQTQRFADQFWRRWLLEYVPIISRRSKWFTKQPPIKSGDVVIIVDPDLPRNCWPKGIVVETMIAKDGQVRSVTVKTKSGVFQRPVAKVALLDVGSSEGKLNASYSFTEEGMLPSSLK